MENNSKYIDDLQHLSSEKLTDVISNWKQYTKEYIAIAIYILIERNYRFGNDMMGGNKKEFCDYHNITSINKLVHDSAKNFGYLNQTNQIEKSDVEELLDLNLIKKAGESIKNIVIFIVISFIVTAFAVGYIITNPSPKTLANTYIFSSLVQLFFVISILVTINGIGNKFIRAVKK